MRRAHVGAAGRQQSGCDVGVGVHPPAPVGVGLLTLGLTYLQLGTAKDRPSATKDRPRFLSP